MKSKLIFSVKMRTLALILSSVVLLASILCVIVLPASTIPNGKTVVLDAGHGGRDGGVVGATTSTPEAEINLAITKITADLLTQNGYNVVLTRKNSLGLYSIFSKNKKLDDMNKRKSIIEQAQPDLIVSIHQNAYPSSSASGPQVFYGDEKVIEVAKIFQNQLNLDLEGKRLVKKGDFFILNCTSYPSVLIECGFLSNYNDEMKLISSTYQKQVAQSIFNSIHSLLFTNDLPYLIE